MLFWLLVAVVFLTVITVLVAAHELGHYLFARLFGMGVEEFSIGFGKKPVFTWMKKTYRVDPRQQTVLEDQPGDVDNATNAPATETTVFTVRPWPLGGFVRIKGMVPEEDGSEVNIPGGFYSKAPWQRFIVLLMGPVFSILAGLAVLIPLYMSSGASKYYNDTRIRAIVEGGAADVAGIKLGDEVVSVDGERVTTFFDVLTRIRNRGAVPAKFVVRRDGKELALTVVPTKGPAPSPVWGPDMEPTGETKVQWMLGVAPVPHKVQLSPQDAATEALEMPGKMISSLMGVAKQPSRFKDEMGGPVSMVAIAAGTTREGIPSVLNFAGALSISLGIFNLLPVSPLDGGQMVVAFFEMLRRGRRLSFRVQSWVAGAGIVLICMLVLSVLAADISRFLPSSKPAGPQVKTELDQK